MMNDLAKFLLLKIAQLALEPPKRYRIPGIALEEPILVKDKENNPLPIFFGIRNEKYLVDLGDGTQKEFDSANAAYKYMTEEGLNKGVSSKVIKSAGAAQLVLDWLFGRL